MAHSIEEQSSSYASDIKVYAGEKDSQLWTRDITSSLRKCWNGETLISQNHLVEVYLAFCPLHPPVLHRLLPFASPYTGKFLNVHVKQPQKTAEVTLQSPRLESSATSSACKVEFSHSVYSANPCKYISTFSNLCCHEEMDGIHVTYMSRELI